MHAMGPHPSITKTTCRKYKGRRGGRKEGDIIKNWYKAQARNEQS